MDIPILYQMPTLVPGLLIVIILLGALEVGYRIDRWRRRTTQTASPWLDNIWEPGEIELIK